MQIGEGCEVDLDELFEGFLTLYGRRGVVEHDARATQCNGDGEIPSILPLQKSDGRWLCSVWLTCTWFSYLFCDYSW